MRHSTTTTSTTGADRAAVGRLAGLAAIALVVLVTLIALPIPSPPTRADQFTTWWEAVGTASATMSLLRHVALAFTAWILAVTAFGAFATAVRWRPAVRAWHRAAPLAIRRVAFASAVVVGASAPAGTLAADPPPLLHDLGPADTEPESEPALLQDLGPSVVAGAASPVADVEPDTAPAAAETWLVQRGDHLWRVAEETLAERGDPTDDESVTRYWQSVIALNRGAIGPDPDLIHPGTVLLLP
ncbi:MAG: hypothetical protein R2707_02705 [Acidimicrobiales bacterium]